MASNITLVTGSAGFIGSHVVQKLLDRGDRVIGVDNLDDKRSFTYIDDIVEGVVRTLDRPVGKDPAWDSNRPDPASSGDAPYRIYNVGNQQPVELMRYIEVLEQSLGRDATMDMLPLQAGDIPDTEADVSALVANVDYRPVVQVEDGVACFVAWYRAFYNAGHGVQCHYRRQRDMSQG